MSSDERFEPKIRRGNRLTKLPDFFKGCLRRELDTPSGTSGFRSRSLRCTKQDHDDLFRFVLNCSRHGYALRICRSYLEYNKLLQDPQTFKNDWQVAKITSARVAFIRAEAKIRYGIIREQAHASALAALYGRDSLESCIEAQFSAYAALVPHYVSTCEIAMSLASLDEWKLGIFRVNGREFIRWVESTGFPFSSPSQGLRAFSYEYFQCAIRSVKSRSKNGPPAHVFAALREGIKNKIAAMESLESDTRLLNVIKQTLGTPAQGDVRRWAEQNTELPRYQAMRDDALSRGPYF